MHIYLDASDKLGIVDDGMGPALQVGPFVFNGITREQIETCYHECANELMMTNEPAPQDHFAEAAKAAQMNGG